MSDSSENSGSEFEHDEGVNLERPKRNRGRPLGSRGEKKPLVGRLLKDTTRTLGLHNVFKYMKEQGFQSLGSLA